VLSEGCQALQARGPGTSLLCRGHLAEAVYLQGRRLDEAQQMTEESQALAVDDDIECAMRRPLMMLAVLVVVTAACTNHKSAPSSAPGQGGHAVCIGSGETTCFGTLAAAVAAAHDGDTVTVWAGTVAGGVTIDKSITLAAAGMHASVIRGGGPVLTTGAASATKTLTVSIRDLTITSGYPRADRTGECGPDIPDCGPGYQRSTALGGGIEVLPRPGGLPRAKVAISNTAVTGNRVAPTTTVPSVGALCPGGPCPVVRGAAWRTPGHSS
jgi:hypothetical protein